MYGLISREACHNKKLSIFFALYNHFYVDAAFKHRKGAAYLTVVTGVSND